MEQYLKDFAELNTVMKRLRAPDGCPWDRAQDMKSLCPHIIEEAYELVEAISAPDGPQKFSHIVEECGDLLLQCVFIATIAEEERLFDMAEVSRTITEKLKRRHPHLYPSEEAKGQAVPVTWEEIKRKEKELRKTEDTSVLSGLPRGLPPVVKAYRLQGKAAGVGFDWPQEDQKPVMDKIKEEVREVQEALNTNEQELTAEIGDLLFAVINLARRAGIDPNYAISKTNEKFERRFRYIEQQVEKKGLWKDFTLSELENFWKEAKKLSL